ncbi:MAG: hypothetical protein H8E33_02630 [Candidatus Cloacimonetes bacterium]|nr:hypothetical protein [Candidatus Cloacimonadota bacterium]
MKKKRREKSSSKSSIIQGFIKLFFGIVNHFVKDWENKFHSKGYNELSKKYKTFENRFYKDFKDMKIKIEKLTMKIVWLNFFIIILLIFVVIEFILLVK